MIKFLLVGYIIVVNYFVPDEGIVRFCVLDLPEPPKLVTQMLPWDVSFSDVFLFRAQLLLSWKRNYLLMNSI